MVLDMFCDVQGFIPYLAGSEAKTRCCFTFGQM